MVTQGDLHPTMPLSQHKADVSPELITPPAKKEEAVGGTMQVEPASDGRRPEEPASSPEVTIGRETRNQGTDTEQTVTGVGAKVNRKTMKLPTFAGKPGESLEAFLDKMEDAAEMMLWQDRFRAGQLYA